MKHLLVKLTDKCSGDTTVSVMSEAEFLFTSGCPNELELEIWLSNSKEWTLHNIERVLAGTEIVGPFPLILVSAVRKEVRLFSNPQAKTDTDTEIAVH